MTDTANDGTIARRADHQLRSDIAAELEWTADVSADQIGVAVSDGAVTLSGQVQTYPEKDAAVASAFRVRGVAAVADEIEVRNPWGTPQDVDIARSAADAFAGTVVVPPGSVHAAVHDHVITLTGTVPWKYQRDAARHAVAGIPGVTNVLNAIRVAPMPASSEADAVKKISAAFQRHARIDAQHVNVTITGGTVTLTGTVESWPERREAESAAWFAPGVTTVDNRITVGL